MRIMVTGAAGRLGRSVHLALLEAGHEVTGVDRAGTDVSADLLEPVQLERVMTDAAPEAVVHLAAISVPFSAPELTILRTNATLTFAVLDAAVRHGVPRVLTASSPTAIGYGTPAWTPDYLPLDEAHPLRPRHAYALSKQVMEETVAMFVRAHGASTTFGWFRPCYIVSPEEWAGALTQQGHTIVERLRDPRLAAVSLYNYVDSRDAAAFVDAWLARCTTAPNGAGFFVGAADAMALRPVAELGELAGLGAAASAITGTSPVFSTALAESLLGWRPTRSWRTELPAAALAELGVA